MIFLTEYKWAGKIMCGEIEDKTFEEAETFVAENGYKERVVGVLIERREDRGTADKIIRSER